MDIEREIERVVGGTSDAPHEVLGPHREGGELVIRAFLPKASHVRVWPEVAGFLPQLMSKVREAGVFEARYAAKAGDAAHFFPRYELEVTEGDVTRRDRDPYSFAPVVGEVDRHLFGEGSHEQIYRRLGAHVDEIDGARGTRFAVWAPSARRVSVVGDMNGWDGKALPMRRSPGGIWDLFLPGVGEGTVYKYEVLSEHGAVMKTDPYGQATELRPKNASRVAVRRHTFADSEWMKRRKELSHQRAPMAIYEVHLGSWRRAPGSAPTGAALDAHHQATGRRWMTYDELGEELVDYVAKLGFTHIELLPVMEHPFDGSWGYQVTGYYAPTARYGEPDGLRRFVDRCHQRGIGVILDWVPAHFPRDAWALGRFDGNATYEHADPRRGEHRQWGTYIFHYGRNEVRNFLIANALYWLDEFHIDGLRVDAVASLLYLDYAASGGEWLPNEHGGRENLDAIKFLRELCDRVHAKFPGALVVAEESTTWPGVTRPTYLGGLGFDLKWNMGWMHDTLDYFSFDPIHRAFHHNLVTFGLMYAYSERFLLPFSHDEVVHLKKSLLSKMPGDKWQMMANLRSLFAYQWAHPGKKLLFMGGEIGQWAEWSEATELDWQLLDDPAHAGISRLVSDLNRGYREHPALHEVDDAEEGFRWIDANDAPQSVASFIRYPMSTEGGRAKRGVHVVFVGNFTPLPRVGYRVGVPRRCRYREILNTDAEHYGGSGMGNLGAVTCDDIPAHGFKQSILLTLPPLASLWLVPEDADGEDEEEIVVVVPDPHAAKAEGAEVGAAIEQAPATGVGSAAVEPPEDG